MLKVRGEITTAGMGLHPLTALITLKARSNSFPLIGIVSQAHSLLRLD
jgi:hypothetical protein